MEETEDSAQWKCPRDVMDLYRLKMKKKALQARMNRTCVPRLSSELNSSLTSTSASVKRGNPFLKNEENKKPKQSHTFSMDEASSDNTLFKLINLSSAPLTKPILQDSENLSSFTRVLKELQTDADNKSTSNSGETWIPIDWTLKTKVRFTSLKPFAWNRKLKTSEEASGITSFVRCLDTRNSTLDTSPNAQFHQCCLYWQHPAVPWMTLFPRTQGRVSATSNLTSNKAIKEALQTVWADSLRSLFQLVRARQCPYFYLCANTFTAVFRAAGICGFSEMHVLLTPTTRGFRQVLRQDDIQFTLPLKKNKRLSSETADSGYDTLDGSSRNTDDDPAKVDSDNEDDLPSEQWLQSVGLNKEDIQKMNYVQAKITHRAECEIDNSEQSLIFVEGVEAHALYNFLINCKSISTQTGPLAGVPPTLLAPVAFNGASLQSLKVRENKIFDNDKEYYSIELSGPILPHTIHNLCALLPKENDFTANFANIATTATFSKVKSSETDTSTNADKNDATGSAVFGQENLSDCGLNKEILKHFCSTDANHIQNIENLKYSSESQHYTWL